MTQDQDVHDRITALKAEQHDLRQADSPDRNRIAEIEVELDQAWDLIRQRDAKRHAGVDPAAAEERPVAEVEGYVQ